jgi:acyl-coenzyme A thioesterase PaaI-like protein
MSRHRPGFVGFTRNRFSFEVALFTYGITQRQFGITRCTHQRGRRKGATKEAGAGLMNEPPHGFQPLPSASPFVQRAGTFFIRNEPDGRSSVGAWAGEDQANAEGFVHGGFLLTMADFAFSIVAFGITLSLTADFLRPARRGDWIEARIVIRKSSDTLIFADALIEAGGRTVMRTSGLFQPFVRRAQA